MEAAGGGGGEGWGGLGLAGGLAGAARARGWGKPTAVQAEAVPPALLGRDVLARAATGSGKTAAYLLPGLHRLGAAGGAWRMLVLVPTRELCEQVREEADALLEALGAEGKEAGPASSSPPPVSVLTLPGMRGREQLRAAGDLVVSTPGRLAACLADGSLDGGAMRKSLEVLVVDEADLLLTYGYEKDLEDLAPVLSEKCHRMLFSATSSPEVDAVAKRVLRNPVVVATEAVAGGGGAASVEGAAVENSSGHRVSINSDIKHSLLRCRARDKLLTTMVLLKTGLVKRKVLIFVGTIDQGFRVKLFLGHFGLHAALLNAELPLNSRHHTIQSFNKGLFDLLIATDSVPQSLRRGAQPDREDDTAAEDTGEVEKKGKKGKPARLDPEFGVARGIDFKGVNTVLNYDSPASVEDYFHRAGRTGRAGRAGAAITLATGEASERALFADVGSLLDAAVGPRGGAGRGAEGGGGRRRRSGP